MCAEMRCKSDIIKQVVGNVLGVKHPNDFNHLASVPAERLVFEPFSSIWYA